MIKETFRKVALTVLKSAVSRLEAPERERNKQLIGIIRDVQKTMLEMLPLYVALAHHDEVTVAGVDSLRKLKAACLGAVAAERADVVNQRAQTGFDSSYGLVLDALDRVADRMKDL